MDVIITFVVAIIEIAVLLVFDIPAHDFIVFNFVAVIVLTVLGGACVFLAHRPLNLHLMRMRTTNVDGSPVTTLATKDGNGDVNVSIMR